ncbi:hypothetical protein BD309DRAFT_974328 [Dichomitus squalens]|nr:hypothetical protein BD309DRAFT_974328 [Dichomitus squalens]
MQPDTSHIHRATEYISGRNVNRGHRQNLQNCLHPSMSSRFREYFASVCPYMGLPPCLRSLRSLILNPSRPSSSSHPMTMRSSAIG